MSDVRERFDRLIPVVLKHEGGYVNDPVDPGGETKYGISKRSYPYLDIKELAVEDAKDIYYRDWWKPLRCGEIQDDGIAIKLLDTAVNIGRRRGVMILQSALRNVGEGVSVDGIIGPQTIAASNRADAADVLRHMQRLQAEHYLNLIENNPKLAKYKRGWLNRAYS